MQQCQWLREHEIKHICGQFFQDMSGMFPLDQTVEQAKEACAKVHDQGLRYASFNASGDLMVKEGLQKEIDLACHQIDMASIYQPKVIVIFAGWQNRNDDAVYQQVSQSLKKIARHAAQYGLTLALENHGGLTTTPQQVDRIIQGIDEPNVGVNYDPANFEMYGTDPLEALKQLQSPIVFTHFKSVMKDKQGKKVYCRLKDGYIDFAPIIDLLHQRDYDGFWAIEYEEPADVCQGSEDDLYALKHLLATRGKDSRQPQQTAS
jgi:sugar phosphate isomerase/epimerase